MSAIEFVVRDGAGALNRGFVGDGATVGLTPGSDISLNLNQGQILAYNRSGTALEITLVDGQIIVIENFFGLDGAPANDLFLSSSGAMTEVNLVDTGNGAYYSTYTDADVYGKFGPDEDLYFLNEPSVLLAGTPDAETGMLATGFLAGAPIVPLLLAGTGAVAAGTVLTDNDTAPDDDDGTVLGDNDTVDDEEPADDEGDGNDDVPGDDPTDEGPGDDPVDDPVEEDPDLEGAILEGTVSAGHIVNEEDHSDGVEISGTATPGATVEVVVEGSTQTTTADADGNWEVVFTPEEVPGGTYETDVDVTLTLGDQTVTLEDTVSIDTEVNVTFNAEAVGGDGTVNGTEEATGTTLTGTVDAGATVVVTINGTDYDATVSGTSWTLNLDAGVLPPGEYDQSVTVTATDQVGNSTSTSGTFTVDTFTTVTIDSPITADNVVNGAEASAGGATITGTAQPGASVEVNVGGLAFVTTASAGGVWSVTVDSANIIEGEYDFDITATATDAAGNSASASWTAGVDTYVNELTTSDPVEGDNIVNREEAADGITLTGTVEAGSTVMVTFEGVTRAATVDADGNWSVSFTSAEIPDGEYEADVTIHATDWVGNTAEITDTFLVDTAPPEAPLVESYTRAGEGIRAISTTLTDDDVDLYAVAGDGSVSGVAHDQDVDAGFGELSFDFDAPVPNGSHLVINASDTSGNSTATLFVLEESSTNEVDITNGGLDAFDIEAVDLQFADDAELTLTPADLEALCAHSDVLTIHGGVDDTVRIEGASATGETSEIGGKTYTHYDLGDTGTLIIDETINVIT